MVRPISVSCRRGSALLIVLGMVAFMVISAVAFSAYMRFTRLPSSYLRRVVASRMLAKAALANAIDEIDVAVGNNPHPGVGTQAYRYPRGTGFSQNRNFWKGRVYIGTNTTALVAQQDTVASLCLEGLAYIPPSMVNEARYYSRHSRAGMWHSLPYDMGRYAFCALDVSDCFDVNAVAAANARTSDAESRISLAYLFEDSNHTSAEGDVSPEDYEDKLGEIYEQSGKVPFVSMADWNLAIDKAGIGGMFSPFCEYLRRDDGMFYSGNDDKYSDQVRRLAFVTDSCMKTGEDDESQNTSGSGGTTVKELDLAKDTSQPFTESMLANQTPRLSQIIDPSENAEAVSRYFVGLCSLGFCALYDYLDYNRVPCSLAVPTVERVPMVCAIQPTLGSAELKLEVDGQPADDPDSDDATAEDPATRTKRRTYKYKLATLNALKMSAVQAMVCYPFRHPDGESPTFKVQGRMSFFFTSSDAPMGLRTGNNSDTLHLTDINEITQARMNQGADGTPNGVLAVPFSLGDVSFPNQSMDNEEDAVKMLGPVTLNSLNAPAQDFMTVVYEWEQEKKKISDDPVKYQWSPTFDAASKDGKLKIATTGNSCSFPPLAADGTVDTRFTDPGQLKALLEAGNVELKLNAAIWVAVTYNDKYAGNKVVDLVPACMMDDDNLNGMSNFKELGPVANQYFGNNFPLLKFSANAAIKLASLKPDATGDKAPEADPKDVKLTVNAIMAADPRYNHNPEDWFSTSSLAAPNDWLTRCGRKTSDQIERDDDIFMSVSDRGYLQSVYELCNLPRLTEIIGNTKQDLTGQYVNPVSGFYKQENDEERRRYVPDSIQKTANYENIWRTYSPFRDKYRAEGDNLKGLKIVNKDVGFRINPYSDNTNVLMAAVANTPHEWRCAAAEKDEKNPRFANIPEAATDFNRDFAWNQYSSGAKLNWQDLGYFIDDFKEEVDQLARTTTKATDADEIWQKVWDEKLNWYEAGATGDASKFLCDVQLAGSPLYCADRKFLYGYWRECFGVRQQLYLVFVRAEPSMMGGEAIGATPPQLGVRAVALVWRDPTLTANANEPHQTRVLFYRQFE